jgi:H+-translocating NAD(P) transhydrogenase subunit beta
MDDTLATVISLGYITATVLFILGLRYLSSPRTAVRGNRVAAVGMLIATVVTLLDRNIISWWSLATAIPLGAVVGVVAARRVAMTAMPQMVALFNGCGGAAAAAVSVAEWLHAVPGTHGIAELAAIALGTMIGAISFSGSLIAFGKLQEVMPTRPLLFPLQRFVNIIVVLAVLALGGLIASGTTNSTTLWTLLGVSLVLGVSGTAPIGGGDMPVVIALLNSMTGLATALTGVVLENEMLLVAGILVGASGMLLTLLMSRAMNRSLANVLFSGFGTPVASAAVAANTNLIARPTTVEDTAVALAYARRVVIVPGYGMAVAQAQHELQAVSESLLTRGVDVQYAVHPVAGRMPGHMNVLLAEANVPYERLVEMDQVNQVMQQTDVVLIVGANDVVNPAAREDPTSPIHGMPIIDADRARLSIVLKRGMSVGFAGIDNLLFYRENTRMLFGDAKKSLQQLVEALRAA